MDDYEKDEEEKEEIISMAAAGNFPIFGPDIRGGKEGRLRKWQVQDFVRYLQFGKTPEGKQRDSSVCRWTYTAGMVEDDKFAIGHFLKSR